MIYAIDNGEHSVEDHEVEFVEADASFGSWWKRKFAPWLEGGSQPLHRVRGIAGYMGI